MVQSEDNPFADFCTIFFNVRQKLSQGYSLSQTIISAKKDLQNDSGSSSLSVSGGLMKWDLSKSMS